jgi:hypothetical protein
MDRLLYFPPTAELAPRFVPGVWGSEALSALLHTTAHRAEFLSPGREPWALTISLRHHLLRTILFSLIPIDSTCLPMYHFEVEMHCFIANPASARNMAMCCCMCMCTRERPVLSHFS